MSDVKMILLMQPEHAYQAERHFKAVAAAIKWYGLWYGRYPFQTLTVVDPPFGGGGAGGWSTRRSSGRDELADAAGCAGSGR